MLFEVVLGKEQGQKLVFMTLQNVRHLPLSKGIVTGCKASVSMGSAGFTWCIHVAHVWYCTVQVFST